MNKSHFDVIFAGGGLAATLTAYRLRQLRPDLRLCVLEAGEKLGGNHTWSFHDKDISRDAWRWIAPFVAHSWSEQQVRFPRHSRMLMSGYNSIFSETLHDAAYPVLEDCVRFDARVVSVGPHQVELSGGEILRAPCVIDARGIGRVDGLTIGYQKFLGLVVRFERPHGQPYPIIMDATVKQRDGYRFVYTLPFTHDSMLIEDTYYSDTASIDAPTLRKLCLEYAGERGWEIAEIVREERGVLPIVLGGGVDAILQKNTPGVPCARSSRRLLPSHHELFLSVRGEVRRSHRCDRSPDKRDARSSDPEMGAEALEGSGLLPAPEPDAVLGRHDTHSTLPCS